MAAPIPSASIPGRPTQVSDRVSRRSWKRFVRVVGLLLFVAAVAVPTLNVVVDPFEVFGTGFLRRGSTLNERVNKTRHVLAQPQKYDSMLFGSSMAGVIDPHLLVNSRASYNFSFFSATPGDVLRSLQMLERAYRLPSRIYIGLDPFMFMVPVPGAPQMRLPPAAGETAWWPFWRDYLFAPSFSSLAAKVRESSKEVPRIAFDISTGAYRMPWDDERIRMSPEEFARVNIREWRIPLRATWWHPPAEEDLARLVLWARERPGLSVTWFLEPLHRRLLDALGEDGHIYFKSVEALVGPCLIDLSRHPIGQDDSQWYEPKHFRPEAAEKVVAQLRSQRTALDRRVCSGSVREQ